MKPTDPIVDLDARSFGQHSREALTNDSLRGALDLVTTEFADRRARALSLTPDWEAWREQARAVKAHTLASLDTYLAQFMERAEANGIQVHVARDRKEACTLVAEIIQQTQASTVVKSKSMVTEEIGLNEHLVAQGLEPVETDLGEWIIQLAGEKPSHIIAPAIHHTREDVGRLFHAELGIPETHDVDELTAVARRFLRARFAEAEVGVSGVNFWWPRPAHSWFWKTRATHDYARPCRRCTWRSPVSRRSFHVLLTWMCSCASSHDRQPGRP